MFEADGEALVGVLHPVRAPGRPALVFVVGGPQYRVGSHRQFVLMARALAAHGYPVLRFDYRGMGDSAAPARSFEDIDADLRAAIDAVHGHVRGIASVVLVGLCDAASASVMYAAHDPRVSGLVLINPWVRTQQSHAQAYVRHYYRDRLLSGAFWRKLFRGEVAVPAAIASAWRSLRAALVPSPSSGQVEFRQRMLRGLDRFDGEALVLLSGRDLTAREFEALCAQASDWHRAFTRPNVRHHALPAADHTFSARSDLEAATGLIARWLNERVSARG